MDPDKPPTKNRGEGIGRNKIPKSPSGNLEARHQAAQAHADPDLDKKARERNCQDVKPDGASSTTREAMRPCDREVERRMKMFCRNRGRIFLGPIGLAT